VMGQADFVSDVSATTQGNVNYPPSLFIDNAHNNIWVPDTYNHRVLRFDVTLGVPTGVKVLINPEMPAEFALSQNYPNPFNPSTTISFAVKQTEHVTVMVYNVLGQTVATLFDGVAAGNQKYSLRFDAKNLTSGVYFYTLRSASMNDAKKMILMK
jgi:hypothetical protein